MPLTLTKTRHEAAIQPPTISISDLPPTTRIPMQPVTVMGRLCCVPV